MGCTPPSLMDVRTAHDVNRARALVVLVHDFGRVLVLEHLLLVFHTLMAVKRSESVLA